MKFSISGETNGTAVELTVDIKTDKALSEDALSRIHGVLRREAIRFSQIAAVDIRDQEQARADAPRLRSLPKDRPAIIVGAGSKDPEAVFVERGSYKVGGKMVHAAKKGA